MKLTDEEWLDMTPRQLHALRLRQLEQMQREEMLVGILAAVTANFSFCRPENHTFAPEEFMMHKLPARPPKPVTGEDIAAAFKAINAKKVN